MTRHLKNSTGVDLQRCHVYAAYGALLLLLSPLSSQAQNSPASPDAPYLKPVTVTASASGGVSPLDDSPAGIRHVTVLSNIEIIKAPPTAWKICFSRQDWPQQMVAAHLV